MAVAVERKPVRWAYGTSPEPFAALLLSGRRQTTVTINRRVVRTEWHDAVVEAWAEIHKNDPVALLPAHAIGVTIR